MPRLAIALILSLLALPTACRRAQPDATSARNSECAAIMRTAEDTLERMKRLEKTQARTLAEALALTRQIIAVLDDSLTQLDNVQVSDTELSSRLKTYKDSAFIIRSMAQAVLTNANAGHVDSVLAQIEEFERFQAQMEAAGDAVDDYCD